MWFFIFWWTFDDHLAAAINAPELGHLPLWVPLLIGIAISIRVVESTKYITDTNRKR